MWLVQLILKQFDKIFILGYTGDNMNDFGDIIEPIFEVSPYRSEILKNIDYNFSQIKKDFKNIAAKKDLIKNIGEFTSIGRIVFTIKPKFMNASIIPIYNRTFSGKIISTFKDYKSTNDLKKLQTTEESSQYISKIYILFGQNLIDALSARQLTAILLHELGHCFAHTSNAPYILLRLLEISPVPILVSVPLSSLITTIYLPIQLIALLTTILFSRSLTFLEHKSEYKADQFAIKYGYGDEMIKVLNIFEQENKKTKLDRPWYIKLIKFIHELMTVSTHPDNPSRIKILFKQMVQDYTKMYPELSNELNIILAQFDKR
jgi:hypothetical protein